MDLTFSSNLTLRFLLRRANLIPRDLVAFLEHATKLVFLRKIGPGYIFIHRLLLEHFAGIQPSLETTPMVSGDERRTERLPEEARRVAERQEAPLTSSTRSLAEECFVEGERYRRVKDYDKAREWYQKAATPATCRPSERSRSYVLSGFLVFGHFDAVHEAGAADDIRDLLGCIEPSQALLGVHNGPCD